MFRNFIYFIVVLLIYTTYQSSEKANFAPLETFALFISLFVSFVGVTWIQFYRLGQRISHDDLLRLDYRFNSLITRQAILAIVVFSIDVYGLNLSSYVAKARLFSTIPTLQALLFIGLFVAYLSIVWYIAHTVYRRIYNIDISRRSYVTSNIQFSLPVLLPWFLLSIVADIIQALPFKLPKQLLATTEGQVIYFLVFLFGIAVFAPALVQKIWRCRPLEAGAARSRIESLCNRAGLQYANILYWPIFGGRMITAGVMGLTKKFRYLLVTDALLRFLEPDEIDAVIAHEIGHVKKKHLVFYLFFFVGFYLLMTHIFYAMYQYNYIPFFYIPQTQKLLTLKGSNPATVFSVIVNLVMIFFFLIYFRYIFGYFMRNFERQADIYVYTLYNNASALIRTFEKISLTTGQPPDRPNWHHFSIADRIGYLKKCEQDKNWISRHDFKLRKSVAAYLAGILLIGVVGYQLNFGDAGRLLNAHFFEKIIQSELQRTPLNAQLYTKMGDLYYSRNRFTETIQAYEHAISLDPNDPQTLNNLAWLYATCEDETFRDPVRAVVLAEKAVELDQSPHLLDTLAESYFVNGRREAAIDVGKKALNLAKEKRSYYEEQLEKFMKR